MELVNRVPGGLDSKVCSWYLCTAARLPCDAAVTKAATSLCSDGVVGDCRAALCCALASSLPVPMSWLLRITARG